MAFSLRPRQKIDYRLLNEGESLELKKQLTTDKPVVLEESYNVKRLISRKKESGCRELKYLVKLEGFHQPESTWEPESHLPEFVVNNCTPQDFERYRLKAVSQLFERTIQARLQSKNPKSVIHIDFDIYRYLFSESPRLCDVKDFERLNLPENWYYILNSDGTGRKIKFPVKLSIQLDVRGKAT